MNLKQKYHGLPSLGITGKTGVDGQPAGKIYFVTKDNFISIFEFSEIKTTKYVYHIINNKFTNNEQVEFYIGGNENVTSTIVLNRKNYKYYPLSYSNETRNKHNVRNFSLEDKGSYFIVKDTSSDDYPVAETTDIYKSRIYVPTTSSYAIVRDENGVVRDENGNLMYDQQSVGPIEYVQIKNEQNTSSESDEQLVKIPTKLRNVFNEGDIIFIKINDLLKTDNTDVSDNEPEKYSMIYITNDLVGGSYQKILNNIIENVFTKYPYIIDNLQHTYHIDLSNVISSISYKKDFISNASSVLNIDLEQDVLDKFYEHNKQALESIITNDDKYQFTIIDTVKTDAMDEHVYVHESSLNNDDAHQNFITITNINDNAEDTNLKSETSLSIWYNHNFYGNNTQTPPYDQNTIIKLLPPIENNGGYNCDNQVFIVDSKQKTSSNEMSRLFVDDPYVCTDQLCNVYVKNALYDNKLKYDKGYLPDIPYNMFKLKYIQNKSVLTNVIRITIPYSLLFYNTADASNYKIGYFTQNLKTGKVDREYFDGNVLEIVYENPFKFTYFVEANGSNFLKYGKSIKIEIDKKILSGKDKRIKNMQNYNIRLKIDYLDTFDMLPDDLLIYTYNKIVYDTEKENLKININPDINADNAYISYVNVYNVINAQDGDIKNHGQGKVQAQSQENMVSWTCDSKKCDNVDITFSTKNPPKQNIFKYYKNKKNTNTFYKIETKYNINYRDFIDEKMLVHYNKVDERKRPTFNLELEKNGNTLEGVNSFSNGINCNRFVTYLYLDINDFDFQYWNTDDAYLDVLLTLNNDIEGIVKSADLKNTVNRAFFKSFNKEKTDINVYITDITNCKTLKEQNDKVFGGDNLLVYQKTYDYDNDDITKNYETGLQIFNPENADSAEQYEIDNFNLKLKNLTFADKHIKLRIDIELSNPVLSNVFMQWQVSSYEIHNSNYTKSYKFDYFPVNVNMTINNGESVEDIDTKAYVQTNVCQNLNEELETSYLFYFNNMTAAITGCLDPQTEKLNLTDNLVTFTLTDVVARYKEMYDINDNIYIISNNDLEIEKTTVKSNILNIAINPVEFIAGRNNTEMNYITHKHVKFYGSDAQVQLYAGFVQPDYEFTQYVDLDNYVLYKKYFQDNVKAITISSTGNVKLRLQYNGKIFNGGNIFNTVFYYNDEELELTRYNKDKPIYINNINHDLIIRDDKLLDSMKAWNEYYEKNSKFKSLAFVGNLSKYSNGYMLLQIEQTTVRERTYYYYNQIGQYKNEYFNKLVYNINDHQFDDKGLYTLTDTQLLNNVIIDNEEVYESAYKDVEQPMIPTMYQPLRNHYFRTLLFDLDWVYTDSNGVINQDKDYEEHLILYPRIAFNTTYDSINVLMLKQPTTYEKRYFVYNE